MFIFGKTTLFLLNNLSRKQKKWYIPLVGLVLFVFTKTDKPGIGKNECERNAINKIAHSTEKIVEIDNDCTIMSWNIVQQPNDSELNSKLLRLWKVVDDEKLYYHKVQVVN